MSASFEQQVWEVYRETLDGYWLPSQPHLNREKASRLETLADRLGQIYADHGGEKPAVAMHIQAARSYLTAQAKALGDYPNTDQQDHDFLAIPKRLQLFLRNAVEAQRTPRLLAWGITERLETIMESVQKVGDLLQGGQGRDALRVLDRLMESVRSVRSDVARSCDRGVER